MLPNFLVAGVAKGGTTTLFHWMKQHPQIWMLEQKEVHFFDVDSNWARGVDWYRSLYAKCGADVAGDVSPGYFEGAERTIPRIMEVYGAQLPKTIILLRSPIDRLYSYWNFESCYADEFRSFGEILAAVERQARSGMCDGRFDYFSGGLYADNLRRWLDTFGRENTMVLLTDDLSENPAEVIRSIFVFLGVDSSFAPDLNDWRNVASVPRSRALMRMVSQPPSLIRWIGRFLPASRRRAVRQSLREINARPVNLPPLSSLEREKIVRLYERDIVSTEELLGRDLRIWIDA